MHQQEGLSFKKVITFNLDEYYPMDPNAIQSYHRFMGAFVRSCGYSFDQTHVPDGQLKEEEIGPYCAQYEQAISKQRIAYTDFRDWSHRPYRFHEPDWAS